MKQKLQSWIMKRLQGPLQMATHLKNYGKYIYNQYIVCSNGASYCYFMIRVLKLSCRQKYGNSLSYVYKLWNNQNLPFLGHHPLLVGCPHRTQLISLRFSSVSLYMCTKQVLLVFYLPHHYLHILPY